MGKLLGIGADNASVMTRVYSGVHKIIREKIGLLQTFPVFHQSAERHTRLCARLLNHSHQLCLQEIHKSNDKTSMCSKSLLKDISVLSHTLALHRRSRQWSWTYALRRSERGRCVSFISSLYKMNWNKQGFQVLWRYCRAGFCSAQGRQELDRRDKTHHRLGFCPTTNAKDYSSTNSSLLVDEGRKNKQRGILERIEAIQRCSCLKPICHFKNNATRPKILILLLGTHANAHLPSLPVPSTPDQTWFVHVQ